MKLSPCKHCGSPAHLCKSVTDPHLCWSVACSNLVCGISTRAFSQQDMAVDAWQRTAAAPKYDHRNGETEVPTVEGRYWFKGRCYARDIADLTPVTIIDNPEILPHSVEIMAWLPGWDGGKFEDIKWFAGRWWGPVQDPWESAE